ncbi:hypothetical protein GTQ34_04310 [Muricauda sp. JGD-17]|uniref:Carboxypeptidase-like regulatory domain-containing protein n=1 Tax=Flagellimonas ochracea TaxID=2696472 RepID=A0A964WWM1_9FLAO|nr:carboxypeptidase-like regulatory domain-containing protein [Allomuricauda ochracea]NAY91135.1 hypothetical protein [Allomuricauda ochracea]
MTQRFPILLAFILAMPLVAQKDFKGKVVDAKTGGPIPYVNIGIINIGIGTVSDEKGAFHLEFNQGILQLDEDVIFSSLGYKPFKIHVSDIEFGYNEHREIKLMPSAVQLQEVVVTNADTDSKFVDELVGHKNYGSNNFGYWKEDTALGGELATLIPVKKGLRKLNSLGFEVLQNNMDSLLVRVNIYDSDGKWGTPKTNLNTSGKNILHKIKKADTYCTVNLKPYSIFVKDDFIVSLELVQVFGNNAVELVIPAAISESGSFRRYASQGKWEKISESGMGYHLDTSVLVAKDKAECIEQREAKKKNKQNKVYGFVISNRRMLAGVQVINMRTKEQVETDNNGRYIIHAKEKDILLFSNAGYKSKQRRVVKEPTMNVILEMDGR